MRHTWGSTNMFTITNEEGDVFAKKFADIDEAVEFAKEALATIDSGPIDVEITDEDVMVTLYDSEDEDEYIEVLTIAEE